MADRNLPELRTRIRLDTSDLDKADSRIRKFTESFGDPKAMAGYQNRLKGISDKADEVGSKLTRNLTLPIVAASAVSVKMAQDFNKSFTTMTSLAGVTTDELAGLKEEVKALASETGRSPQELAEALYFIRSAGLDGADAMDALEASAKGAAIGLGETKTVADAATSAVNAYGSENITAGQAVDILTAAVAEGKGEAEAFAPQLGQLLPLAKQLGVGFEEVAGSVAFFTKTGTPVAQAATMVQGVLQKLIAPTQQGREAFKDYGISLDQLKSTVANQGLLAGLQLLNDKVGGDPQKLRQIFDDIEGYTGVLGLLNNGGKDAAEVLDNVANSADSVAQAFARVQGTDEFAAQQAITDLQVAAIELGQTLIPIVTDIANGVSGLLETFNDLPDPVQKGILALVGMAALLGPLAKGLSIATNGLELLMKAAAAGKLDSFRLGLMGVGSAGGGASAKLGSLFATIGAAPVAFSAGAAGVALLAGAFIEMEANAKRARDAARQVADEAQRSGRTAEEVFREQIGNEFAGTEGGISDFRVKFGQDASVIQASLQAINITNKELADGLFGTEAQFDSFFDAIAAGIEKRRRLYGDDDPQAAVAEKVLNETLPKLRSATSEATVLDENATATKKEFGVATEDAADSTDSFSDAQVGAAGPTAEATDELQKQVDAARALYDAHRDVADTADGVADAQKELADAQRAAAPGSEENRRALEAIADAEQAVQDAQRSSEEAQRSLTDARKEAQENFEDLALAASGAQVDEAGAAVALERAKSDLLKAKTPLERREAEQRIREAEQALAEAKDKTGDTAGALADARAKGIDGSDAVVAAQQRITDARNAEKDAQGRLAEATTNAATIREEAADKVREASENLTDAELDHIDAQAQVVALTDGAAGSTDVLIEKLSGLAAKLDPNDPLRKNLTDYIADLKELAGLYGAEVPDLPANSANGTLPAWLSDPGGGKKPKGAGGKPVMPAGDLPSASAVNPDRVPSNVTAMPSRVPDVVVPITVLGNPDEATVQRFREVAKEAVVAGLKEATF